MDSKMCRSCMQEKLASKFHAHKRRADGLNSYCKDCQNARSKAWREANIDRAKELSRSYYQKNSERVKEKSGLYYESNKESCKESRRRYASENKLSLNAAKRAREARRFEQDPNGFREWNRDRTARKRSRNIKSRLSNLMRNRVVSAIRHGGYQKRTRTSELLGCSWNDFIEHIQRQFSIGMSWSNYGKWHIDHIIPLASAASEDALIKLFHYTNLQPLWAEDNIRKGASIPDAA